RAASSRKARSSAAPRFACSATRRSFTKAHSRSSSASRTTSAKCRPARSAAWPSRTTRTSAKATRSSVSRWRRSRVRSEHWRVSSGGWAAPVRLLLPAPMPDRDFEELAAVRARCRIRKMSRYKTNAGRGPVRGVARGASAGPSQRMLRVGELVRHRMAELLARGDIHDDTLAGAVVTIPEVRMSPDLKLATVYVMPLGGHDVAPVIAALTRNAKYIRGEIARAVNLKFAPEI